MSGHKKDIIICVADKNKGTDKFDFVSVVKFENNIIEAKCVARGEWVGGLKELHFHCLSVIFLLQMLMVMKEKRFIVEIEIRDSQRGFLHVSLFFCRFSPSCFICEKGE